jgi:hypothetical protein
MLVAYFVGLMVTQIVDRKLGEIEIRMPKINIPEQQRNPDNIILQISKDRVKVKRTKDKDCDKVDKLDPLKIDAHPNYIRSLDTNEHFLNVDFGEDDTMISDVNRNVKVDSANRVKEIIVDELDYPIIVETETPPTEIRSKIGCVRDEDCNVVNGGGKNVCKADGSCYCLSGSGPFCQYGPTNYKDPKDMTPDERKRFKFKYRNNMTLQDYKNWLYLYKDEIENLKQHHRRNLIKLMKGGALTERDVPAIRLKPPTDAADYFQKMYKGGKISVHFPDNDSPLVGANYNQYTDFIPPENAASSWITGVVDLYKEAGKDDAKALDYYVRPDTRVKLEEQAVGDIYQKYLHKNHNVADMRILAKRLAEHPEQIPISQRDSLLTFESQDPNVREVN